ncbi:hypothetical protein Pelo_14426 [Pelomyxa schiedti]|nr:hypothetical protein Pelo_14426 [Pelomyxa schiedti]
MSAGAGPVPSACVTQSSFVQWMRDNNLASAAVMSTLCNPADAAAADAAQADADGGPACDYVSASSMAVQMEAMRKKELHDAQKEIRDAAMSIFAQEVTLRPGIKTGRQGDAAAAAATTTTTTTTLTTNNSSIGKNEQITNPVEGTPQPPAVEMVEDVIPINTNMQPFQSPPQPEGYAVNNYPQATSPNPQVQHKTPKQRGRHPGSTNKQTSPPNAIASLGLTTGQYSKLHRILMTLMEPSLNDYSLQFGELTPPEREALLLMMHNLALNLGHLRLAQTTTTLARTLAPLYHPPPPQQPPSPMTVTLLPSGADRPTSHSIIRRQQIKPYTEPLGVTVPLVPLQLEPITSNLEPQTM